MKFLHTADWHVGKTLKGRDRLDEQRAVLAEIASIAEANEVDAVLVAGDVYDLSAPSAPAQQLVVQALLRMRRAGAEVIVIAGNHDHGPTFEAYRPLMGVAGITLAGMYRSPPPKVPPTQVMWDITRLTVSAEKEPVSDPMTCRTCSS